MIFEPARELAVVVDAARAHAAALERVVLHDRERGVVGARAPRAPSRRGLRAQVAALDLAVERVEVEVRDDARRRGARRHSATAVAMAVARAATRARARATPRRAARAATRDDDGGDARRRRADDVAARGDAAE